MMLEQVPEEFRISGRMSDKALFYMPTLRPGTVISLDDVNLSDSMQEILKGVTTSFQTRVRISYGLKGPAWYGLYYSGTVCLVGLQG